MIYRLSSVPVTLRRNIFVGVLILLVVGVALAGIFFATLAHSPYTAELTYVEYSEDANVVGSVVPASCESNPINSHYNNGVLCQCAISATPSCSGSGCDKTISWNTNYNGSFGLPNLRANGVVIGNVALPTGSMVRAIPPGGQTFSLHRPDGVQLCASFVPGPLPPSVTFTGVPTTVNFGSTTNLNWTVANVTSCTASGGWSGAKAVTAGTNTETVTPSGPTTYTLTCSGPGGGPVTRNVTIDVVFPSGSINTTSCIIPDDGANCAVNVDWSSTNFFGAPRVAQGANVFSALPSSAGQSRLVNPDDDQFTLSDTGSSFTRTVSAFPRCTSQSTWTGTICRRVPVIIVGPGPVTPPTGPGAQANVVMNADQVVRRGDTADVDVQVNATYNLTCTLSGAVTGSFTYLAGGGTGTQSYVTAPLQAAAGINISCASTQFPSVVSTADVTIQVIPSLYES